MDKATTVASYAGLLAVALFALSCTESISPERSGSAPSFSFSANGITLSRSAGTLNQSGQLLIKGFNPTNPHHGDAIVATFFWLGSTFIVDSVYDVLTTNPYTPVGNKYTLVEYVQAGGYSMATYVATNIQNFPDAGTDPGQILAVAAQLRQPISDGGLTLAAFTGVEDNFTIALGAHNSKSGSGSQPMFAHADPIAVNAGALAYTVTMSGLWGLDAPQGFNRIGPGSDNAIKDDAAYAVQSSAGTVDPQWGWFFGSSDTWLVTTFALNAAVGTANQPPTAAFTSSCSGLTCSFTSTSSDPDGSITGYSWTFGDGGTSTAQNPSRTYAAGGTYTVTLRVTDNQGAQSITTSKTVTVTPPNQSPTANFTSSCSGLTCSFTSTSSDPDGSISAYSWTFGDGATSTAQNPSRTYAAGGTYTVTLRVTDNQGAQSTTTSKTVTVTAPNQPPVVNAGPDQTALTGLLYTLQWSFSDANHNGPWSYTINWGDGTTSTGTVSSEGSFSRGHTYVVVLPRSFTIRVTVTDAAGVSTSDTKVVTVLLL